MKAPGRRAMRSSLTGGETMAPLLRITRTAETSRSGRESRASASGRPTASPMMVTIVARSAEISSARRPASSRVSGERMTVPPPAGPLRFLLGGGDVVEVAEAGGLDVGVAPQHVLRHPGGAAGVEEVAVVA